MVAPGGGLDGGVGLLLESEVYAGSHDLIAKQVARLFARRPRTESVELLLALMELSADHRVLDLACGPGFKTSYLARRLDPASGAVVGVDLSEAMLGRAVRSVDPRTQPHVRWVRADAARLPFFDGAFDRIHCGGALHFVRDVDAVLAECRRVLAPGGRLVVSSYVGTRRRRVRRVQRLVAPVLNVRLFDREDLFSLLVHAGFRAREEVVEGASLLIAAVPDTYRS